MRVPTRRSIRFVLSTGLLAAGSLVPARGQSPAAARITVGANVQVSQARSQMIHNEVLLAADPRNPAHLIGCSMVEPGSLNTRIQFPSFRAMQTGVVAYVSFDGGEHWSPTLEIRQGPLVGDPTCAIGPDGSAYLAALPMDVETKFDEDNQEPTSKAGRIGLIARYSKDGGKTWLSSTVPPVYDVDRDYLVVDDTDSRYAGRVYLYCQSSVRGLDGEKMGLGISLWRSTDGGARFENPVVRPPTKPKNFFHPGNAVVLSDGMFVALFSELRDPEELKSDEKAGKAPSGAVKVAFSTNGGDSLTKAVKVSDLYFDNGGFPPAIPSLGVDHRGPFKDRLYAVWPDQRSGRLEILAAHSSDKGKSWSTPQRVNDDPGWPKKEGQPWGPNSVVPAIAVNKDGVVGVTWYDRRDNPDGAGYWVRFAASLDGGETWSKSLRVSEAPNTYGGKEKVALIGTSFDAKYDETDKAIGLNVSRNEWVEGGHTAGLAADAAGRFHSLWVDNRTGIHQVWTAPIDVHAKAARNGSADLASLDDLSTKTVLELAESSYDEAKHEVRLRVSLRNISDAPIRGPLKVRLIGLRPGSGDMVGLSDTVEAVNADNHEAGPGAIWDFTSLVPSGGLAPDAVSGEKLLLFRTPNPHPFHEGAGEEVTRFRFGLLNLKLRVLGRQETVKPDKEKKEASR